MPRFTIDPNLARNGYTPAATLAERLGKRLGQIRAMGSDRGGPVRVARDGSIVYLSLYGLEKLFKQDNNEGAAKTVRSILQEQLLEYGVALARTGDED